MCLLTKEERSVLRQELATFISGNPVRLTTIIPANHFIRIGVDSIPELYAENVIRYCEISAWVEKPALILRLLEKFDHFPPIYRALERNKNVEPPRFHVPANEFSGAFQLAASVPFLSRGITRETIDRFRNNLESPVQPAGLRVLIVRGPKSSGKTFTYDFLRYVSAFLGAQTFRTAWVDIKKQTASWFGPLELTMALLEQINPKWQEEQVHIPKLEHQQPSRWIKELCAMLVEQISVSGVNHTIVIDGLSENKYEENGNALRIPRDTIDMILYLTDLATGKEVLDGCDDSLRMVLLGFSYPIKNFRNRVRVEDISPVSREDVEAYFKKYAAFYQKQLAEEGLKAMVDKVFENDKKDTLERTRILAEKAMDIATSIINPQTTSK